MRSRIHNCFLLTRNYTLKMSFRLFALQSVLLHPLDVLLLYTLKCLWHQHCGNPFLFRNQMLRIWRLKSSGEVFEEILDRTSTLACSATEQYRVCPCFWIETSTLYIWGRLRPLWILYHEVTKITVMTKI